MVSEDQYTSTIGELIESGVIVAHKDGNHGSNYPRSSEFGDEGVPFLTAKLVSDSGRIDFDNAPRLNLEKANKIKFGYVEEGDVLLSHNATVGRVALVPELREKVLIGTSLTHYRLDSRRLLPKYLAAYFRGRDFQNQLSSMMGGMSTRNQVPITAQRLLTVVIPPLEEQKAIAHILGSLDDKIELNRQMNETLEAMAQALFKSWFVDFDPVIDNALAAGTAIPDEFAKRAEQRKGIEKKDHSDTQNLFPDEFECTEEMGWIPKEWQVTPVYEVAEFINGSSFKSQYFSDENEGLPIIKIAEIKNGVSQQTNFTTQKMPEKYFIDDGSILFSWSGNPDTSIDTFIWTGGEGWLNQHIFNVVLHKNSDRTFVYYLLKMLKPVFTEIARDKQTTGLGHVTVKDMKRTYTIKPSSSILEAFTRQVDPIFEKWYQNLFSSRELTKLRDTLLPKLMSGELRIPDAEALVEYV